MQRLVRGLAPCIVLIAFAAPAAQSQTPPALTLERALELARQRNPELAAAIWEVQAAEAAIDQAGVLPNPELELAGDNLGNQRLRAEGDRTTSLQISQLIELGGKRAARVRLARTSLDVAAWESRAKRTEIVMRVKPALGAGTTGARLSSAISVTKRIRSSTPRISPPKRTGRPICQASSGTISSFMARSASRKRSMAPTRSPTGTSAQAR